MCWRCSRDADHDDERRAGSRRDRGLRGGVRAHRALPEHRLADRRRVEVADRRRARRDDQDARPGTGGGDRAPDRRGAGEGRERRDRDAVRHIGARQHLDRDLRLRDGGQDQPVGVGLPERSVRRRRPSPALELLDATLPELRRGLTESAARTVAYELFEKLGYGAVAVTDAHRVLAFVGAGADHHHAGDRPIRPVYAAIARDEPLLAPLGIRTECDNPACPLGAAAVVPLRTAGGVAGAVVAYATAGSPLDEGSVAALESVGRHLSSQLQLSELATATTAALQ